jgi:hypothetical protein
MTVEKIDPGFSELLGSYDLVSLRQHSQTIYGIWPDFRLSYVNPGWFRFALENQGEPEISTKWRLGTSILDAIASPIRAFYKNQYQRCLQTRTPWSHEYECSSPTLYRWLHQSTYPLGRAEGLLIVNSLKIERLHDPCARTPEKAENTIYRDKNGVAYQCPHCRRFKNLLELERWDWVPEWVKQMPSATSHTLCGVCFAHYYPNVANG